MRLGILAVALVMGGIPASASESIVSEFGKAVETWQVWCPGQMILKRTNAPPTLTPHPENPQDGYLTIAAVERSLGGNRFDRSKCSRQEDPGAIQSFRETVPGLGEIDLFEAVEDDDGDDLGPPIFDPSLAPREEESVLFADGERRRHCPGVVDDPLSPSKKAYCTLSKWAFALVREGLGGEAMGFPDPVCMQRQEVRFHPSFKAARHYHHDTREYALRFRLPSEDDLCDRTNRLRWVTAQWKLTPLHDDYTLPGDEKRFTGSPFLAQRFDRGYLMVTVQSEHCRCVVAAAEELMNNPFRIAGNKPLHCRRTSDRIAEDACTRDNSGIKVEYTGKKWLHNALGQWTTMAYDVRPSMTDGRVEIRQDGATVAIVSGRIGYRPAKDEPGRKARVKFKFGMYRDYQPKEHAIDYDRIELGPVRR